MRVIDRSALLENLWPSALAALPNGNLVVAANVVRNPASTIQVYDLDRSQRVLQFDAQGHVTILAVSPDGSQIASSSNDGIIRIWSVANGNCEANLPLDRTGRRDRLNYIYAGLPHCSDLKWKA